MEVSIFLDWVEAISSIAGLVGAIFSAIIWLQLRVAKKRAQQPISVKLVGDRKVLELPLYLTRENLSRAEILAPGISSPEFLQRINDAKQGSRGMILIPASEKEIDQFDL